MTKYKVNTSLYGKFWCIQPSLVLLTFSNTNWLLHAAQYTSTSTETSEEEQIPLFSWIRLFLRRVQKIQPEAMLNISFVTWKIYTSA